MAPQIQPQVNNHQSPHSLPQPAPVTSHTHTRFDTQLPREREISLHDSRPSKPTSGAQIQEQMTRKLCFRPDTSQGLLTMGSRRGRAGTEAFPRGVPVRHCPLPAPLVDAPARGTSWATRPPL